MNNTILENFYKRHNAEKVGEVGKILEMYQAKLPVMFETLENRYGVPAVTEEVDIEFGDGSLGLMIKEVEPELMLAILLYNRLNVTWYCSPMMTFGYRKIG